MAARDYMEEVRIGRRDVESGLQAAGQLIGDSRSRLGRNGLLTITKAGIVQAIYKYQSLAPLPNLLLRF